MARTNSSADCGSLDRADPRFEETVDQTEDLLSYLQLLETGLPLLIICLVRTHQCHGAQVGPLSDTYGRKWILFGNLAVTSLQPLGYLLLHLLPFTSLPTWILILPSIPASLVGFDTVVSNTVFSYAGDVSHGKSSRSTSIRFIILDTISALFTPVGLYGGDFILKRGGFTWLFAVVTACCALSSAYALVFVKNIIPFRSEEETKEDESDEEKPVYMKLFHLLSGLVTSVTKKRKGWGRFAIILLIVILGTHAISYTTDSNICFIFLQTKFGFDQNDFSVIQSIRFALTGGGALFMIGVIQLTDINVLVIGLISSLSKLGYYLE